VELNDADDQSVKQPERTKDYLSVWYSDAALVNYCFALVAVTIFLSLPKIEQTTGRRQQESQQP